MDTATAQPFGCWFEATEGAGLRGGEGVEQDPLGDRQAAGHEVQAAVVEHPQGEAAAGQRHPDAGHGADRPFERRAGAVTAMRVGAAVEQQGGPALERLFLPADHQLADPRGRAPVHLAQVVAVPVLPGGGVVAAGHRDRAGHAVAAAGPVATEAHRRQRADDRCDDEFVGGCERPGQLTKPERVGEPHRQRADAIATAHLGPDRVGDLAHPLGLDPVQHEAGAATQDVGQRVLHQQHPAGQAGHVVQTQSHRRWHAGLDPWRVERPRAGQPVAGPGHDDDRCDRQDDQEDCGPQQVALAKQDGAGDEREAGAEQAPAPGRQPLERRPHAGHRRREAAASGNGTRATKSPTTASGVRRDTCASAVGSRRWASTAPARSCTSSGRT